MCKRIPVTVCGTKYRTITECCNALGVRINTVYKKLQSDKSITLEQAILQSIPDIYEIDLYTAKELQQITGLNISSVYHKFGEYSTTPANKHYMPKCMRARGKL